MVLALSVIWMSSARAAEVALFVKGDSINLRSGPGERFNVIGSLRQGEEVRVQAQEGFWRKVSVPQTGATGWVARWLLSETPPGGNYREIKYVNGDDVQIRSGPGSSFGRIGLVNRGIRVEVIAYEGQWRKIRIPATGEVGWVADWLLKPGSSPASSGGSKYGQRRYVATSDLSLRRGPGVEYSSVGMLDRGDIVYIMDGNDKWVKVHVHDGPIGWVFRHYLSDRPPSSTGTSFVPDPGEGSSQGIPPAIGLSSIPAPTEGWVAVAVVNIRSGPGPNSDLVGQATANEKFSILDQSSGWYRVRFAPAGVEGWVASWLVGTPAAALVATSGQSTGAAAQTLPRPTEMGSRIVQTALKYLRVPYRYGGSSPRGFDCSGLVHYVLLQVGIRVPRTSYDQWTVGQRISQDQLLPGDLVFFSNLSHVGIYIGNGNFVHAPYSGSSVRIQSLAERAGNYCGARRVY